MENKNSPMLSPLSRVIAATESLAEKLEKVELHTCKDSVSLRNVVPSSLRRIDLTLDAIWKSLMVLHNRTEFIAQKVEILQRQVLALQPPLPEEEPPLSPETTLPSNFVTVSSDDEPEWLNSLMLTPEHGITTDILCSETPFQSPHRFIGQSSMSNGFMDPQELASLDELMNSFPTPILKTPARSGGMDTS